MLVCVFVVPSIAAAQDSAPTYEQPRGNRMPPVPKPEFRELPARFSFGSDASALLGRLWAESAAEKREHVACITGEVRGDSVRITNVMPLESRSADSLGVSAQGSIDQCGPPDWLGTAHTHVARYDGEHPYKNMSGADRGIIAMWWRRWQVDGLFCVLYSETEAFCQVLGAGGPSRMSRGPY